MVEAEGEAAGVADEQAVGSVLCQRAEDAGFAGLFDAGRGEIDGQVVGQGAKAVHGLSIELDMLIVEIESADTGLDGGTGLVVVAAERGEGGWGESRRRGGARKGGVKRWKGRLGVDGRDGGLFGLPNQLFYEIATKLVEQTARDEGTAFDLGGDPREPERRAAEAVALLMKGFDGGRVIGGRRERLVVGNLGLVAVGGLAAECERTTGDGLDVQVQFDVAVGIAFEGAADASGQLGVVGFPEPLTGTKPAWVEVVAAELKLEEAAGAGGSGRVDATALLDGFGIVGGCVEDDAVAGFEVEFRLKSDLDSWAFDRLDAAQEQAPLLGVIAAHEDFVVRAVEETVGEAA